MVRSADTPGGKYRYVSPLSIGYSTKTIDGAIWHLLDIVSSKQEARRIAQEERVHFDNYARVESIKDHSSLAWYHDRKTDKPKTTGYAVWIRAAPRRRR